MQRIRLLISKALPSNKSEFPFLFLQQNLMKSSSAMSQPQPRQRKKSILSSPEHLPYDVVYDILTYFPVKSLIRFRCVSKSWKSLITNPIFITTHFNFNLNRPKSLLSNNNAYLLYVATNYPSQLCTVVCNRDRTLTQISRFQIPFSHVRIAAFCKGLFFLRNYYNDVLYLWNPSIRKFNLLPPPIFNTCLVYVALGIAYHSQNNDFKILKLCSHSQKVQPVEAEVYTLSTDSWRRVVMSVESEHNIGSIDYIDISPCLFFNGALHSIAGSRDHYFILSFDVNDERFREIMLPPNNLDEVGNFERLAVIKGSLAWITFSNHYDEYNGICNIWVMKEYGVVESWTKNSVELDWFLEFCGCFDDGELLIQNASRLVSFENVLAIEDAKWVGYTSNSMESLVLLDDVSSVDGD